MPPPPTHPAPGSVPSLPQGGTETLLLVEDNYAVRRSLGIYLGRLGYRIIEAIDAPSALLLWETHGPEIDLLLTDMVMPGGITGLELAAILARKSPSLPIIISSGYHPDLNEHSIAGTNITLVPKPTSLVSLAGFIRERLAAVPPPADSATDV